MSQAIIRGLLQAGTPAERICASAPSAKTRDKVQAEFGIRCYSSNRDACAQASIILLGVKPQRMQEVCNDIRAHLAHKPLIISVAAGINNTSLQDWLGIHAIVRCMPNTPSAIGLGASGYFCNAQVSGEQADLTDAILSSIGVSQRVDEEHLIDAVTAVSGSAPAYFFLFLEAMANAGEALGLPHDTASKLAIQTALGAATLAQNSDVDVTELRKRVTSPKGTTEQAILSFQQNNLDDIVKQAMQACANRAQELSLELGSKS